VWLSLLTPEQGSDTRVRTQKKPSGFFGYTHLKNPPPKNPHFYSNLILVYTLYSTNNAIFYCFWSFWGFKLLSLYLCTVVTVNYWRIYISSLCIILPIFSCVSKKPDKTPKKPTKLGFFKKTRVILNPAPEWSTYDLHIVQLMPLPPHHFLLHKIQNGSAFLEPAYPGCPGKKAVKWVS